MEKNIITLLWLMTTLLSSLSAQTTEWEFKREDDGITAYTRTREGIKFKEYKVETMIDADLSQILAVFKDFEVYPDIFPGTTDVKAYVDEPDHHITYIKFRLPFPIRDRDAIFHNKLTYDAAQKYLHVDVACLTDEYETNPKLIQITTCDGAWHFYQQGVDQTKIIHTMVVDPGGAAPAWIVNTKTVDDPITTLKALKKVIQNDKYRGKSFPLLKS